MAFPWMAAATIGSSLLGGITSAFGAKKQNKAAQQAAQTQMDFQREMSNTQYQRAMADMKKAGLNPMLAYQQGGAGNLGGSSYTPANIGAAAVQGAGQLGNIALGQHSAKSTRRTVKTGEKDAITRRSQWRTNVQLAGATIRQSNSQTNLNDQNARLTRAQVKLAATQDSKAYEEMLNLKKMGLLFNEDLHSAKAAAARAREQEKFYKENPNAVQWQSWVNAITGGKRPSHIRRN